MAYSLVLNAYENYIMGVTKKLSLPGKSPAKIETEAKECIRYAVTDLMGWSPEDAVNHMKSDIMSKLKVDMLVNNYVKLPLDCNKKLDIDYVMAVCLDEKVNRRRMLERYQKRIEDKEITRFPKELFSGEEGRMNAAVILSIYIKKNIYLSGSKKEQSEQLYARFGNTTRMNAELKRKGIYYVSSGLYNDPLEYLHCSLPYICSDLVNDHLYGLYSYLNIYRRKS